MRIRFVREEDILPVVVNSILRVYGAVVYPFALVFPQNLLSNICYFVALTLISTCLKSSLQCTTRTRDFVVLHLGFILLIVY